MLDVLCVGDSIYDMFIRPSEAQILASHKRARSNIVDEPLLCFGYGSKINIEELNYSCGGSSANVAVGLKKLGMKTGVVSFVGDDYAGTKIKEQFDANDIDQQYLVCDQKINTSLSFIMRYRKERTILIYRDKFDYATLKLPKTRKSKWLYISHLGKGYEEVYKKAVALASEKNVRIALNPGKTQLRENKRAFLSILKLTEILFLNKEEAEMLVGSRFPLEIKELYYKLANFGAANIVITNGKRGAYVRGEDKKIIYEKSISVESVEKTGAGDAFSAAFLASYAKDKNLSMAIRWGVINGAKVTEEIGAQYGILTHTQIREEYKKIY